MSARRGFFWILDEWLLTEVLRRFTSLAGVSSLCEGFAKVGRWNDALDQRNVDGVLIE